MGGVRKGALVKGLVGANEDVTSEGLEKRVEVSMTDINPKVVNQYFI